MLIRKPVTFAPRRSPAGRPLRRPTSLLLILAAACGVSAHPARAAGQPVEQGRVTFDADVRPDPDNGTIDASWRLDIVVDERAAASGLSFLLNRGLTIERLVGSAVRGHRSEPFQMPVWNLITVTLAPGTAPGDTVAIELAYAGRPELPPTGINAISPARVELNVDSGWHPVIATFDQELTGTLRLRLPAEWEVVSSGSSALEDGAHAIRYEVPQLDVAFYAAPRLERTAAVQFVAYHAGAPAKTVDALLDAAESCATYLNGRYGSRQPLPTGHLVLADRTEHLYARKNYLVLSRADDSGPVALHRFLCHELAHFWTAVANPFGPDHWLLEAFAEYVAARYVRQRFGSDAFAEMVAGWERQAGGQPPVWTPASTQRGSDLVMYRKAPWLLSRLEERIGTPAFDELLTHYMVEDVRTTRQLLARLAEIAGPETEAWFREELGR